MSSRDTLENMASARLLDLLRADAWRRGTFTLASGRQSDFFIDCKQVMLTAEGHALTGELLYFAAIHHDNVRDARTVAGVVLGGCPLVSAMSMWSWRQSRRFDGLYVRKESKDHGTRSRIEGKRPDTGTQVVLVEDVITTGASALTAVDQLADEGFRVVLLLALVDRQEGGAAAIKDRGIAVHSLYSREDFLPTQG